MLTRVRSELVLTFGARCMVIMPVTVSRARPRITLHYEPSCLLKLKAAVVRKTLRVTEVMVTSGIP